MDIKTLDWFSKIVSIMKEVLIDSWPPGPGLGFTHRIHVHGVWSFTLHRSFMFSFDWWWTAMYYFILTFLKQAFNVYLDFRNRSKSHERHTFDWQLPSSHARALRFVCQKWHCCSDRQRATLSRTCKISFLFAPLAVCVHAGWLAFPFYTPPKPLIRLHNFIKYKSVFFLNYK